VWHRLADLDRHGRHFLVSGERVGERLHEIGAEPRGNADNDRLEADVCQSQNGGAAGCQHKHRLTGADLPKRS
jgi:hypothetical protein